MKEYKIEIMETLARIVTIEANSFDAAMASVIYNYNNADLVLDADDFVTVEFNPID